MQKANADSTFDAGAEIPVQLKLYASLGVYLPNGAEKNIAKLKVASGTTILDLLDSQNVPREMCTACTFLQTTETLTWSK